MAATQIALLTPQTVELDPTNPEGAVRKIAQLLIQYLSGTGSNAPSYGVIQAQIDGTATFACGHLYLNNSVTTDTGEYTLEIDGGSQIVGTAPFDDTLTAQGAVVATINSQFLDWRVSLNLTAVAFENVPYTTMVTGDTITVDGVVFTANTDLSDLYTGITEFNPQRFGLTGSALSAFPNVMQRHPQFNGVVGATYSNSVFASPDGTWLGGILTFMGIEGGSAPASVVIDSPGVGGTHVYTNIGATYGTGLGLGIGFYFYEARDHFANYKITSSVPEDTGIQPTPSTGVQGSGDNITTDVIFGSDPE